MAAPAAADVVVSVDAGQRHQTMAGFGATHLTLTFMPGADDLTPTLRAQAIDAVYNQVKLSTGNLNVGPQETPGSRLASTATTWRAMSRFAGPRVG